MKAQHVLAAFQPFIVCRAAAFGAPIHGAAAEHRRDAHLALPFPGGDEAAVHGVVGIRGGRAVGDTGLDAGVHIPVEFDVDGIGLAGCAWAVMWPSLSVRYTCVTKG